MKTLTLTIIILGTIAILLAAYACTISTGNDTFIAIGYLLISTAIVYWGLMNYKSSNT